MEDTGEQVDNKESKVTKEGEETSQVTEHKTEDVDEMISSTSTQDFDRKMVEKEFVNLTQHYQSISNSFTK